MLHANVALRNKFTVYFGGRWQIWVSDLDDQHVMFAIFSLL